MSADDIKRLDKILTSRIKNPRPIHEVKKTFVAAGFIDYKGRVKNPYKSIFIDSCIQQNQILL